MGISTTSSDPFCSDCPCGHFDLSGPCHLTSSRWQKLHHKLPRASSAFWNTTNSMWHQQHSLQCSIGNIYSQHGKEPSCKAMRPLSDTNVTSGQWGANVKQMETTLAKWKSGLQRGRQLSRWHSINMGIVLSLLPMTMHVSSPKCNNRMPTSIENMPPECSALPLWPSSLHPHGRGRQVPMTDRSVIACGEQPTGRSIRWRGMEQWWGRGERKCAPVIHCPPCPFREITGSKHWPLQQLLPLSPS